MVINFRKWSLKGELTVAKKHAVFKRPFLANSIASIKKTLTTELVYNSLMENAEEIFP